MKESFDIFEGMATDVALLKFLRTKGDERFARLDAFLNLYDRMLSASERGDGKSHQNKEGEEYQNPLGSFECTISELANTWNWHRATVRTFIKGLEELGYVRKQETGKTYLFSMPLHASISVPFFTYRSLLSIAHYLVANYYSHHYPAASIAHYLDVYYQLEAVQMKEERTDEDLVRDKVFLLLSLTNSMENAKYLLISPNKVLVTELAETFKGRHPWSWKKWITALMYLDMAVLEDQYPLKEDSVALRMHPIDMSEFSENDWKHINALFDTILSDGICIPPEEPDRYPADEDKTLEG